MAVESNADVAAKVRGVAAERGATQSLIARHLGFSGMAVSRRMSGETPFSPEELIRVAALFGVPVSVFFGESISLPAQKLAPAVDVPPVDGGGVSSSPAA